MASFTLCCLQNNIGVIQGLLRQKYKPGTKFGGANQFQISQLERMISALCWIAREAAKDVPVLSEPTEEELKELKEAALAGAGVHLAGVGALLDLGNHYELSIINVFPFI